MGLGSQSLPKLFHTPGNLQSSPFYFLIQKVVRHTDGRTHSHNRPFRCLDYEMAPLIITGMLTGALCIIMRQCH